MYKIVVFILLLTCTQLNAQILPKESSKLHYRIIGFSFPVQATAVKYEIDIAEGACTTESSFEKNKIIYAVNKTNKIVVEVPSFGSEYTWRVVSITKDSSKTKSILHHFSTIICPGTDTTITRLRITNSAEKYNDAYVFLDGTKALYDMKGKPVWILPNTKGILNENSQIRDLKLSPKNTITFIAGDSRVGQKIYEMDYNGNILWTGPNNGTVSGDSIENYHHEFTRLINGHYMVLGSELISCRIPVSKDSNIVFLYDHENKHEENDIGKIPFGTLIEYDEKGKVVWSWKCSEYYKKSDIVFRKRPAAITLMDVHDNGFFFDEKNNIIYLSFRNINRIIKLKYPEKKVLNAYGDIYKTDYTVISNDLFCGQHSCGYSQDGYLFTFNNNSCSPEALPTLIKMQEPTNDNDSLKKVWEYKCKVDGIQENKQMQYEFHSDGNVIELPDHSLFASMSSNIYSKVFIVNLNKEVLWSAIPEKWNPDEKQWETIHEYRASIINSESDLERMIWFHAVTK